MTTQVFSPREIGIATVLALLVQASFLTLLAFSDSSRVPLAKKSQESPAEIPIEVMPVLDERPLLKLGSKKQVKSRLPEMWQKRAPQAVKRYEERSAPSKEAKDSPDEIPKSKLADSKHEAPPEDAEIVEKVDQELLKEEEKPKEQPELNEEGAADGVEEGTEPDPLKARQVDLYRRKIAGWFNARFRPPVDSIPCEVLKKLSSGISVRVGSDRRISSYSVSSPSGNPTFDAKVRSTMTALTGEQLPPPPPLYPDILGATVFPRLSGAGVRCE